MYVLLGRDTAESKHNLVRWLGEIVLTRMGIDQCTLDQLGNKIPGRHSDARTFVA